MGAICKSIPEGTRTLNLWLRKPTPYPFGHRDGHADSDTDPIWVVLIYGPKVRSRGIEPRPPRAQLTNRPDRDLSSIQIQVKLAHWRTAR